MPARFMVLGDGNQAVAMTGNTMTVVTGAGAQTIAAGSGFASVTIGKTPYGAVSTIQIGGLQNGVSASDGNVRVDGAATAGNATVTLGNGDDVVTLGGSNNVVVVGTGASTLTVGGAGSYNATVRAGGAANGGSVTVTVGGKRNVVDVGPGKTFINAPAATAADLFIVNGSGQGLTTISGFSVGGDRLDLTRTLAGTSIGTDVAQIGKYVTASLVNGGTDTLLSVDPSGGAGKAYGFVLLSGVQTTVGDMLTAKDFVLR